MAPVGGAARGARDEEIGQTLKIGLVEQHEPVFLVCEHVLTEVRRRTRQTLGDRRQSRLGFGRGSRASAGEIEMVPVEHARLFGRQPGFAGVRLDRVDTLEQSLVQIGLAAMAREFGRDFALDRLQLVIRVRANQIEKHTGHSVEAATAALEGLDCVGEGRRLQVGRDYIDLCTRLG